MFSNSFCNSKSIQEVDLKTNFHDDDDDDDEQWKVMSSNTATAGF